MKIFKKTLNAFFIMSLMLIAACSEKADDSLSLQKNEKGLSKKAIDDIVSRKGIVINGQQEVPSNASPAKGKLDVSYNKSTKMLSYTIQWESLTGNPVAAHIHGEAPVGVNAGIKHHLDIPASTSGTLTDSVLVDEVAIKEADLLKGMYYVNIHTPMYPGGEIRAQIEFKKNCDVIVVKKGLKLCGAFEVPANNSKAAGTMDIIYNKTHKMLTYTVKWKSLTGNPVAAHIHGEASKEANASVKHHITIPAATSGITTGSVVIDEVAIKEAGLLSGLYYVNIHTAMYPGGEIRGQIEF